MGGRFHHYFGQAKATGYEKKNEKLIITKVSVSSICVAIDRKQADDNNEH